MTNQLKQSYLYLLARIGHVVEQHRLPQETHVELLDIVICAVEDLLGAVSEGHKKSLSMCSRFQSDLTSLREKHSAEIRAEIAKEV